MNGITDILYLNSNEKVQVTTFERSILLKNENIDINIAYNEIFNYTIEKEYISLYMYSRYYKKVKEIINNKNEYSDHYIIVKLYYNDSTNKIVKHFDKLIKDQYKEKVEEGFIFASCHHDYILNLKCGFEYKKNSEIHVTTSWNDLSISLCEKDYFNRLKKSYYVPHLLFCKFENIVSVKLTENCLTILIYIDEYGTGRYTLDAPPSILDVTFYTVASDKEDYYKIELYGDNNSLSELKSRIEPRITFTSPIELKLTKEKRAEIKREEQRKTIEKMKKRRNQDKARQFYEEYINSCIFLYTFSVILVLIGTIPGLDIISAIGGGMFILSCILTFFYPFIGL